MTTRLCLLIVAVSLSHPVHSEPRSVPKNLFGIELGSEYEIKGFDFRAGNLPVRKFAGFRSSVVGPGIVYFFQPDRDYHAFEYFEKNKSQENEFLETSFALYLLPKIGPDIKFKKQFAEASVVWEVALISWSGQMPPAEAYGWAKTFCRTFTVDIGQKPEIEDQIRSSFYKCIFSEDDRIFEVSTRMGGYVGLSYNDTITRNKEKSISKRIREIHANEIRPYENLK